MTEGDAQAVAARAAELRDAAINTSTAAWRITGLEACSLVQSTNDFGLPLSLEEVAGLSGNSLGWAALAERARRIADAWSRAAEDWQAADAHLQIATAEAIAELRRRHGVAEQHHQPHAAPENGNERRQVPPRALQNKEAFQIKTGPSYRTVRRPTPNGVVPAASHRVVGA